MPSLIEQRLKGGVMSLSPVFNDRRFQTCFLAYSSLLIFLGRPTSFTLRNFDDTYYAQKAKELLDSGNFWVVLYAGQPSFDNTPLPLWLMTTSFRLFGVSAYSAVLPSALLGVATVLLCYRFAEYLFQDRWTAFLAATILIFPGFFADSARRAMVDVPLTFLVTAALFCFLRASENAKYYIGFGLCTGLAILTKSILGLFPLLIVFFYLVSTRQFKELYNYRLLVGIAVALIIGSSWYVLNWQKFGESFLTAHFGWLIVHRAITGSDTAQAADVHPLYFLGYFRSLFQNYWPWVPIAIVGAWKFSKRVFKDGDRHCLFILLWIFVILSVMSVSKSQTLRYILSIFPALAILTAQTIAQWLSPSRKEAALAYVVYCTMAVVLFITATPITIKSAISLSEQSTDIRFLAPIVRMNTAPKAEIGNYRLPLWSPRNSLLFYSDRILAGPVLDPTELVRLMKEQSQKTWLTSAEEFRELRQKYPGELYLIHAYGKHAFFTAQENQKNIRYDVSGGAP